MLIAGLNLIVRIIIYYKTSLFRFSDYSIYLNAIESIHEKGSIPIINGNSLFTLSYIGYFSKYILGSLDYFFILNCFLGTITTVIISFLVIKVTENKAAGIITSLLLTGYTEFMVFSSVFYTPIIMVFLLSLLVMSLFYYYHSDKIKFVYISLILIVYSISFFFKPELLFLPVIITILCLLSLRHKGLLRKNFVFLGILLLVNIMFQLSGMYTTNFKISNDFIFFGHTDYGGDGGEGSFIYNENKIRYEEALNNYRKMNKIEISTINDRNKFQISEIKKFILDHPLGWIRIQSVKFFRTFGIVPESTSFKILYTGLLKQKIWLTSIIVVIPIVAIILSLIICFDYRSIRNLIFKYDENTDNAEISRFENNKVFLKIYLALFLYYIFISVFLGHYQERYRIPIMALFIIPQLGYFISIFDLRKMLSVRSVFFRCTALLVFLIIWAFQLRNALSNKTRFNNAIEIHALVPSVR